MYSGFYISDHVLCIIERGTCIKGLFWPPLELKRLKFAFHQYLLIGLLDK